MLKESFAFVILRERSDRRIWAQDKLREESRDPSLLLRVTNFILFFSLYLKEAICAHACGSDIDKPGCAWLVNIVH
jgi:hypothetical protein